MGAVDEGFGNFVAVGYQMAGCCVTEGHVTCYGEGRGGSAVVGTMKHWENLTLKEEKNRRMDCTSCIPVQHVE